MPAFLLAMVLYSTWVLYGIVSGAILFEQSSVRRTFDVQDLGSTPFLVDPQTGAVQTNQSYGQYSDGYFQVTPHFFVTL